MKKKTQCPTCGLLVFQLKGELLKGLVGVESLGNDDGFQTFMESIPDERWEAAARALNGEPAHA